jgi:hypothetical protein
MDPKGQFYIAYAYAGNGKNPIVFIDPNGEWIGALIGGIAGAYIGGAMSNGFQLNPGKWDWENMGTYLGVVGGAVSGASLGNAIETQIRFSNISSDPTVNNMNTREQMAADLREGIGPAPEGEGTTGQEYLWGEKNHYVMNDGEIGGSLELDGARRLHYEPGSISSNAKTHWHVQESMSASPNDIKTWGKMTMDKAKSLGLSNRTIMEYNLVTPEGVSKANYIWSGNKLSAAIDQPVFYGDLRLPKYTNWGKAYWSVLMGRF